MPEEHCDDDLAAAWDDVDGRELDPEKVKQARMVEVQYYRDMGTHIEVPLAECWRETCKAPIKVRWIDHNKGDSTRENYRSRLVCRQFNTGRDMDLFAGTPPLEAMRMVISDATTGPDARCLMLVDVSRAYMHAPVNEKLYVEIAGEARTPSSEGKCWKLLKSMHGTRPAALNWQKELTRQLESFGFVAGRA